MKATDVFLITIFRASLQPYLKLVTIYMTRDTLIKHKEATIICEESGQVIANYNILITQPKFKLITLPIVTYTNFKQ